MQATAVSLRKVNKPDTRERSNWLMRREQRALAWLCRHTPAFVTSDMLTVLGLAGSGVIFVSIFMAQTNRLWLVGAILGLSIHWLGDSLDGRLAYFRNRPRKWYGFALDIMVDWISLCIVAAGLAIYFASLKFIPVIFMVAYGARMLIAVLSYKILDVYRIDSGKIGPTEVRILTAFAFCFEIFVPGSLLVVTSLATVLLLGVNVFEFYQLLQSANARDKAERPKDWGLSAPRRASRIVALPPVDVDQRREV